MSIGRQLSGKKHGGKSAQIITGNSGARPVEELPDGSPACGKVVKPVEYKSKVLGLGPPRPVLMVQVFQLFNRSNFTFPNLFVKTGMLNVYGNETLRCP